MGLYFWNADSWGSDIPPVNYEEVCAEANRLIQKAEESEDDARDAREFADQLWEDFCASGTIGGVTAIYDEE